MGPSDTGTTTGQPAHTRTRPLHLTWGVSDGQYVRILTEGGLFVAPFVVAAGAPEVPIGDTPNVR